MDTEPQNDQSTDAAPSDGKPPIIAGFLVRVTVRGDKTADIPTNAELEGAIQREVASLVHGPGMTFVSASAERVDK